MVGERSFERACACAHVSVYRVWELGELQLCLFLKPTYSCSARERESWGASERPDAVTARLPVVGGEEEDKETSATSSYPMGADAAALGW